MNFDSFNVLKVRSPSRHNHQCCPQHRQQNLSWWKIEKIIGEFARWDQISNITFFTADKLAPFPRIHKKLYHRTIGDGSQREPERDNSCRHGIGGLCRYFLLKWRFCYWAILLRNIRLQNFTGKSWNTGNVLGSKNLFRKLMFSNLSPAFHNSARKDKIQYSAQDQSRLYTVQWTHRLF